MEYIDALRLEIEHMVKLRECFEYHLNNEASREELEKYWETIQHSRRERKRLQRQCRNLDNTVYSRMCCLLKEKNTNIVVE